MIAEGNDRALVVESLRDLLPEGVVSSASPSKPFEVTADELASRLLEWEKDFEEGSPPATIKAVRADWHRFVDWCARHKVAPIPVETTALLRYLREAVKDGRRLSTLRRYLYSIRLIHRAAGAPDPTHDGIWRQKWKVILKRLSTLERTAPTQATPLQMPAVAAILAKLGDSPHELRDGAMLALASDTLCRESELVRVVLEDIEPDPSTGAWTLRVGKSKTDGLRRGSYRYVSPDTKARIDRWCAAHGINSGPLFVPIGGPGKAPLQLQEGQRPSSDEELQHAVLRPREVARMFRRRAIAAGLPEGSSISGHSTRVGTALDLDEDGASIQDTMAAGGWKSQHMVLHYTRRTRAGRNAVANLRRKSTTDSGDPQSSGDNADA